MRVRTIHPDLLCSPSLANLSYPAETLFYRLLLLADDAGRMHAEPRSLAARAAPTRTDMPMIITPLLDELEREKIIERYQLEYKPYLRVVNLRKWQRTVHPTPSRLPPSPAELKRAQEDSRVRGKTVDNDLNGNENRQLKGAGEDFFGDDGAKVEFTEEKIDRAMKRLLDRSASNGKYTAAARMIELMSRRIGMFPPRAGTATATKTKPADPPTSKSPFQLEQEKAAEERAADQRKADKKEDA